MKKIEIALLWDNDTPFRRYLIDNGFDCEIVTPNILPAPLFTFTGYKLGKDGIK